MTAYYNEIDPYAAQWLRNLIEAGHIAFGVVDERSIEDVRPDEIAGYAQCHFFAGIGVWSLALRSAGWSDDRPVWTGSCPCQPFSSAGEGNGFADERHLWPAFNHLIEQCRPSVVFGEQVASKAVEPWIDLVHADVEALGYAFGAVAFPSAGVGAPHIRDRLFWVADSCGPGPQEQFGRWFKSEGLTTHSTTLRMAHPNGGNTGTEWEQCSGQQRQQSQDRSALHGVAHADSKRLHGFDPLLQWAESRRVTGASLEIAGRGPVNGFWGGADWISCRDDRFRPVEPGTFPLANGAASRVGRLRAYGNAINAEAARVFIESVMDCMPCRV